MKQFVFLSLSFFSGFAAIAQDIPQDSLVLQLPGMRKVNVHERIPFKKIADTTLTLDIYYPRDFKKKPLVPVVVFNNGVGAMNMPQWRVYKDWARLIAAKGMIAVNYQARKFPQSFEDGEAALDFLRKNGVSYGMDTSRMALWTSSANVPVGMRLANDPAKRWLRCLVVYYGEIDSAVYRQDLPILMVKVGLDAGSIGSFMQQALMQDVRIEMINNLNGMHGFDLYNNTDESRDIIERTVAFIQKHLYKKDPEPAKFILTNRNFMWLMLNGQMQKALSEFRITRDKYRADPAFNPYANAVLREDLLNGNAYWLLRHNKQKEALETFKLIVESFPESPNAYDGLADAYESLGNKAGALKNTQICLQKLDNANINAQFKELIRAGANEKLKRLQQ